MKVPMDVLKGHDAEGEIAKEEYERMEEDLEGEIPANSQSSIYTDLYMRRIF